MAESGDIWIEDDGFHYIDESGVERFIAGFAGGAGQAGYIWIEGVEFHYIDANGTERTLFGLVPPGVGVMGRIFSPGLNTPYTTPITVVNLPTFDTPSLSLSIT